MSEIHALISEIRAFADARDWEIFHTPKNLSMAVAGEAGELVSEFQWLTAEESRKENLDSSKLTDIKMEIADVALYLFRLADVLDVDLAQVMREKMRINESRFKIS
jgi:NTP pyrophosphatase (non-canonical NTP hydrolase)